MITDNRPQTDATKIRTNSNKVDVENVPYQYEPEILRFGSLLFLSVVGTAKTVRTMADNKATSSRGTYKNTKLAGLTEGEKKARKKERDRKAAKERREKKKGAPLRSYTKLDGLTEEQKKARLLELKTARNLRLRKQRTMDTNKEAAGRGIGKSKEEMQDDDEFFGTPEHFAAPMTVAMTLRNSEVGRISQRAGRAQTSCPTSQFPNSHYGHPSTTG